MKKQNRLTTLLILLAAVSIATSPATALAQLQPKSEGEFAVGIILGAPTGITGKVWLDSNRAIDGGLAFSANDYILLYSDYLIHNPRVFGDKNKFMTDLDFYYGVGGVIVTTTRDRDANDHFLGKKSGSVGVAVRVPFGAEWRPLQPPVGVFVEIVPGMSIIPATSVIFQGGIGVRYYF